MYLQFPGQLPLLAVLTAAVAYFILGIIWYSSFLFGRIWDKHAMLINEDKQAMGFLQTISFFSTLIVVLTMGIFIRVLFMPGWILSVKIALLAGLGFMFIPAFINGLYLKKPIQLLLIDGGYHLAGFVLSAIILSIW